ncbi:hypothetical protein [Chryseobacterium oryctis]|uniref:hypothetical protein n=1 Tax=Chryseobacterium oryctis TaxID=2952618 RepID=UPI0022283FE9|nr:hypothetical protein [Chryseobacterium oryctis]
MKNIQYRFSRSSWSLQYRIKQFGQGSKSGFPALCPLERINSAFSGVSFSELYVRTLKFVMAWDLKIDAAPKIFQKKTKKKTEKKRKKKALFLGGEELCQGFLGKVFAYILDAKIFLQKPVGLDLYTI